MEDNKEVKAIKVEWSTVKGDRFLVEIEILEDHDLIGSKLMNLFYNTEKVLGKNIKFQFNQIYLKRGHCTISELKDNLKKAFDEQLEKMFVHQNYDRNEFADLIE